MSHDPEVTGSTNISKVTPEWSEILTAAREQGAQLYQEPYLMHTAIAMVNAQVQYHGTPWVKCANCGSPFRLDLDVEGRSSEICSGECHDEYVAYLNSPEGQGRYDDGYYDDSEYGPYDD